MKKKAKKINDSQTKRESRIKNEWYKRGVQDGASAGREKMKREIKELLEIEDCHCPCC